MDFVEKVCPCFPEDRTVDIDTWKRVGTKLQDYYDVHGPSKVPVDTFSLWTLIRDSLYPRHGREKLQSEKPVVRAELQPSTATEESETKPSPPLVEPIYAEPAFEQLFMENLFEPLDPEEAEELEKESAKYREDEFLPFVTLAKNETDQKESYLGEVQHLREMIESYLQMQQIRRNYRARQDVISTQEQFHLQLSAGLDPQPLMEKPPVIITVVQKLVGRPCPLCLVELSLFPLQAAVRWQKGERAIKGFHCSWLLNKMMVRETE